MHYATYTPTTSSIVFSWIDLLVLIVHITTITILGCTLMTAHDPGVVWIPDPTPSAVGGTASEVDDSEWRLNCFVQYPSHINRVDVKATWLDRSSMEKMHWTWAVVVGLPVLEMVNMWRQNVHYVQQCRQRRTPNPSYYLRAGSVTAEEDSAALSDSWMIATHPRRLGFVSRR